MLVRIDLENHFPSVSHHRVYAMFRNDQGCTPDVARILTRLTILNGGLPQGSPTSTIISNLVTMRLSKRLRGFAQSRGARYTQYVDDYTFSGNRRLAKHSDRIVSIVAQEGFKTNPTKTMAVPADRGQVTTGIRVNGRQPDIPRSNLENIHGDMDSLHKHISLGSKSSKKTIQRIEGKICYVRRWNLGAAKSLTRKLARITLKPANSPSTV